MSKFVVILTRDTTESCVVLVEAADAASAEVDVLAGKGEVVSGWTADEGNVPPPAYVTDVTERR